MVQETNKSDTPAAAESAQVACETVAVEAGRLIDSARRVAVRTLNSIVVADYWLIGQSVVGLVKNGLELGMSDEEILRRLGERLSVRSGPGFGAENLHRMCRFYLAYPASDVSVTPGKPGAQGAKSGLAALARRFPLSWSHYQLLIDASLSAQARSFYEAEALRKGWTASQLKAQMAAELFERTEQGQAASASAQAAESRPSQETSEAFEEELRDACLLEFFGVSPGGDEPPTGEEFSEPTRKSHMRRKPALQG